MLSFLTDNWLCIVVILVGVATGIYMYRRNIFSKVNELEEKTKKDDSDTESDDESNDQSESESDEEPEINKKVDKEEEEEDMSEYLASEVSEVDLITTVVEGIPNNTFTKK
jgi:hypothetical protein